MDTPRRMICNGCGFAFVVQAMSWREAEGKTCPKCRSKDTTPILEQRVDARERYA